MKHQLRHATHPHPSRRKAPNAIATEPAWLVELDREALRRAIGGAAPVQPPPPNDVNCD
jgi:hypothetical protein